MNNMHTFMFYMFCWSSNRLLQAGNCQQNFLLMSTKRYMCFICTCAAVWYMSPGCIV